MSLAVGCWFLVVLLVVVVVVGGCCLLFVFCCLLFVVVGCCLLFVFLFVVCCLLFVVVVVVVVVVMVVVVVVTPARFFSVLYWLKFFQLKASPDFNIGLTLIAGFAGLLDLLFRVDQWQFRCRVGLKALLLVGGTLQEV